MKSVGLLVSSDAGRARSSSTTSNRALTSLSLPFAVEHTQQVRLHIGGDFGASDDPGPKIDRRSALHPASPDHRVPSTVKHRECDQRVGANPEINGQRKSPGNGTSDIGKHGGMALRRECRLPHRLVDLEDELFAQSGTLLGVPERRAFANSLFAARRKTTRKVISRAAREPRL